MILYFSATGNSAYVAKRISRGIGDNCVSLFDQIRNQDVSKMHSENPWIIVVPTYAWRIPRIVQKWIEDASFSGSRDMYFILTCGENIGNAGKYAARLCRKKNMRYRGCMGIKMPENYLALFPTPSKEKAAQIIKQAQPAINQAIRCFKNKEPLPQSRISLLDRLSSGIVNDLFYPIFVHARKFFATDACISCEKCAQVCPLGNIRIEKGKPVWGENCTHCMACISRCPKEAIEYGKRSKGRVRYVCSAASILDRIPRGEV